MLPIQFWFVFLYLVESFLFLCCKPIDQCRSSDTTMEWCYLNNSLCSSPLMEFSERGLKNPSRLSESAGRVSIDMWRSSIKERNEYIGRRLTGSNVRRLIYWRIMMLKDIWEWFRSLTIFSFWLFYCICWLIILYSMIIFFDLGCKIRSC